MNASLRHRSLPDSCLLVCLVQIMVGGKNVRDLDLEDLRKATAVVPQDTALFNETIAYNIAYAKPSSTEVISRFWLLFFSPLIWETKGALTD